MRARDQLLLLLVLVTCLRLPFVRQAFQLDDPYYLEAARYVQHDPAHPAHASVIFQGLRIDMRGHPHPPLDIWFLGLVLHFVGRIREAPFHLAYLVFSLLATAAMYRLARRFTSRPAMATLLFIAIPAFVVHGNGLESDLPFLALGLAGAAAFIQAVDLLRVRWLALAAVFLALAALTAYQAVLLVPILALYAWARRRRWWPALAVSAVPLLVVAAYQLYEGLTSGTLPATVLAGYFQAYQLQNLHNKFRNTVALTAHLAWALCPPLALAAFARLGRKLWIVAGVLTLAAVFIDRSPLFWASFGLGVVVVLYCLRRLKHPDQDTAFLAAWIAIFFAGALVVFYAGSARYLLPLGAPLAILAVRALDKHPKWLLAGFEAQLIFSLLLAWVHYQHSGAYRDFVRTVQPRFAGHQVWINGEWGLQYYGQQAGAKPLLRDQALMPGDWVITSRLGYPIPVKTPGGRLTVMERQLVQPSLPLRLLALGARSAFSTISFGVRPFDIRRAPVDVLTAELVVERLPERKYLPMNATEAPDQIVSGIYNLESNRWRWMGRNAIVQLKRPEAPARLEVNLIIPAQAPARRVRVSLDGALVADQAFAGPGQYTLSSQVLPVAKGAAMVAIAVDKTFSPRGDQRELGIILNDVGFK